jgi:hypothetical protein
MLFVAHSIGVSVTRSEAYIIQSGGVGFLLREGGEYHFALSLKQALGSNEFDGSQGRQWRHQNIVVVDASIDEARAKTILRGTYIR